MAYREQEYLQLSGLQHFSFCRRQWALAYIEGQWHENVRTAEGRYMHKKAHDTGFVEKRKDLLISRDLPVFSSSLGVSGACDVVEFHQDMGGVSLFGREGLWRPIPVEYKRGTSKENDADRLQLCCQAMCLEEMLVCDPIQFGYLYYGEIRRREKVELSDALRVKVKELLLEMHSYQKRGYTPKAKRTKSCNACSLQEYCVPKLQKASIKAYWEEFLEESL